MLSEFCSVCHYVKTCDHFSVFMTGLNGPGTGRFTDTAIR